jgi:hypothetical protein
MGKLSKYDLIFLIKQYLINTFIFKIYAYVENPYQQDKI